MMPEPLYPGIYASDYDSPDQYMQTPRKLDDPLKPLTTRESVELFHETVETAKQGIQQSLAGSGKAGEALRPKLTVDLKSRNLGQIPSEVVTIIQQDVERLQLAHNKLKFISPDFAICSALKYLNLRDNRFSEIPQAIFGLPQLEILDLSQNQLNHVPDEINHLKALRVFSVNHNHIKNLPLCLGNISTLRILKIKGNPLNPELIDTIYRNDNSFSPVTPGLADNDTEKEKIITARVVEYLRALQNADEDNQDNPMETPRAMSRFPVHPNDSGYLTSGSESGSGSRSPGFLKAARSHHRGASSQYISSQNIAPRRPGLAPLALGNDRNRSNSESVLQATQNNKSKRMGIVPKKNADLEIFDESKAQRNSFHLRGQSHNSALRNVVRASESPKDDVNRNNSQNGTLIRRLSSVREQRQQIKTSDDVVEGAKGILYSLHSVQSYLSSLANLVKDNTSKRSSLERYHYQASVQIENLDQSLHDFANSSKKSKIAKRSARKTVCRATHACIGVYSQIGGILLENINQLIMDGDPMYIRTLMLLLYGSFNEQRNARRRLQSKRKSQQDHLQGLKSQTEPMDEKLINRDDALTPTQDYPKPGRRWANGTVGQSSLTHTNLASVLSSQRTVPVHSNMSSRSNSRSNSRAGFYYAQTASSITSTPRSGDSFGGSIPIPRSRADSITLHAERARQAQAEQDLFERIYVTLNKAAEQGLQVIPYLEPRFKDCLERSLKQWSPMNPTPQNLWKTIVARTRHCGDMSEALRRRLQQVNLNDIEARSAPDYWRLATRFTDAYGNLLASLREARQMNLMDADLRHRLRPVHRSIVDAGTLIQNSPWDRLTKESQPPSLISSRAPTPVQNVYQPAPIQTQMMPPPIPTPSMAAHQHFQHRRPNGSNGSATGSVTNAYNTSVPATPLSAALGPAAQATVPTTPASGGGSLAGMFEGNVFQRADNLLLQGTMFRRPGGAP